jgi:hypothetical protein
MIIISYFVLPLQQWPLSRLLSPLPVRVLLPFPMATQVCLRGLSFTAATCSRSIFRTAWLISEIVLSMAAETCSRLLFRAAWLISDHMPSISQLVFSASIPPTPVCSTPSSPLVCIMESTAAPMPRDAQVCDLTNWNNDDIKNDNNNDNNFLFCSSSSLVAPVSTPFPTSCQSIVTIPNGYTGVPARAFDGCSNLLTVNLPSSVTDIESYAFLNTISLQCVNTTNTSVFNAVIASCMYNGINSCPNAKRCSGVWPN